jgi:hypothetical protein
MLPLQVERPVHADGGLDGRGDRVVAGKGVSLTGEEGTVPFDLDQVKVASGIDHLFEEPRGVYLGVGEAHSMGAHVLRVSADISDQEDSTLRPHGERSY